MQQTGKLYLIPVPLGETAHHTIPQYVKECLWQLDYFIVERAKTARYFIKAAQHPRPLPELEMVELSEHTKEAEYRSFLAPALSGRNIGLMSEAGCPGVADPGAAVVELAHRKMLRRYREVLDRLGAHAVEVFRTDRPSTGHSSGTTRRAIIDFVGADGLRDERPKVLLPRLFECQKTRPGAAAQTPGTAGRARSMYPDFY